MSVLIETKQNFTVADEEQLSAYVEYEKALTGNKIIAILANTTNDNVKVWRGVISDGDLMPKETALRTMDEYVDFYTSKINDKEKVMQNTYKLNEMLHRHSIPEKLRSQFVGTCLLALKNGLDYATPSLTAAQIRTRIKEVLEDLLNSDINKAEKLALLNRNVLGDQYVRQLTIAAFREILKFIEDNILPFMALSKILCKSKTKQAKGRLARASIIWDFLLLQYSRRVKRYARRRRECRFTLREKY